MTRVTIDHIGARGDGVAETPMGQVFVPFSIDGEDLEVKIQGKQGRITHIYASSPDRVTPKCVHFGRCGGCAMQHVAPDIYSRWKQNQVRTALSHRGFDEVTVLMPEVSPEGARRRARLNVVGKGQGQATVGFSEKASHNLIDITACPVMAAEIENFIRPLRSFLSAQLKVKQKMAVQINLAENGLDVIFECAGEPNLDMRMDIAAFAETQDVARICWFDTKLKKTFHEIMCERRKPFVTFAGRQVFLPPGAFLQATKQGEQSLTRFMKQALGAADKVVDIFAGVGTFTVALIADHAVHAVEGDVDMIAALKNSAGQMGKIRNLTTEVRDLFLRPLLPHELNLYDAVVLDPPRAGARDQVEEIVNSTVGNVVMISCNPATFARDARTLVDGGFVMGDILPVDQFLYSSHVEVVAHFTRAK